MYIICNNVPHAHKSSSVTASICGTNRQRNATTGLQVIDTGAHSTVVTGVTCGAGTANHIGAPEFTPPFLLGSVLLDL